jgi:hypothetical protein
VSKIRCQECGGRLAPRNSGFHACVSCGKLVVAPKANDAKLNAEADEDPKVAEPTAHEPESKDDILVPDYMQAQTGWRAWGIPKALDEGELPLLRSVTYSSNFWTPREPMRATCQTRNGTSTHPVPTESCTCGLYSAKTREHLLSMNYHNYDPDEGHFTVLGRVALWGKVVEGTQGWKAEFGYPQELFLPYEAWHLFKPLEEAYGVPVRLDNILRNPTEKEVK